MSRRSLTRAACYLSVAIPILACGASGGGPVCRGWVEDDQGVRHGPESGVEDRDDALRFACNGYCREADPQYDAMYRMWLDSPQGDPSVSKDEAIFRDDSLMQYVTGTCASRCLSEVAAGSRGGGVDCEE